jgi:UDP-2-acetamido-2,6-beta-L-arabino-hexul-4-ose reductase
MKKIGITGQAGFVGKHLYNTLSLDDTVELIPFERSFFENSTQLEGFVAQCDVIVHLAAMNRHEDANVIYNTNIDLVNQLINACRSQNVRPHIIFSSSSQEEKENRYGQSKKEGKEIFMNWAETEGGKFTSQFFWSLFKTKLQFGSGHILS